MGSFVDIAQKLTKTKPKFTFVDLSDSQQEQKKESFTNEPEARAVWDLLAAFDLDLKETVVLTPYRTQALMIKNSIEDLPKKLSKFETIGSFEDFISTQFSTIVISHCRSEGIDTAGPLFSQAMIEFVLSRLKAKNAKVIVIGKLSALNQVWRTTFAGKQAEMV